MEEQEQYYTTPPPIKKASFVSRHSTAFKVFVVAVLTLFLLIPLSMISSLIYERLDTKRDAELEVTSKWSGEQIITGPIIVIPYFQEIKLKDKHELLRKSLLILPSEMDVLADAKVEKRKRGIYDVSLYRSNIEISGLLSFENLSKTGIEPEQLYLN